MTDSIGDFPLGFRVEAGDPRAALLGAGAGRALYVVEARKLSLHQKEAVVRQGDGGSRWRVASDEGKHLKGTDLAPFPLGFFNAGLQADLMGRIAALANSRGVAIDDLGIELGNAYSMTGSFFRGDGEGFAEPAGIKVNLRANADAGRVAELVDDAVAASPALAAMSMPLRNTFAIYVNGRRRTVETMPPSPQENAPDPFATWRERPAPEPGGPESSAIIRKTGAERAGTVEPAPAGTATRIVRIVKGIGRAIEPAGLTETDTWLELPGMSHFALKSDERPEGGDAAPSGLALLSAGIAFCFMTQLERYIEHMNFDIGGVRLVQYCPYMLNDDSGHLRGAAGPVDTHLFVNGREDDETCERLMRIAARTCYLHATLAAALDPVVGVEDPPPRLRSLSPKYAGRDARA